MPFDQNGQALVAGQRPVNGQDTDASQINVPLADIQSMLSQLLLRSGIAPMTGNLNMNGFKIQNLPEGTSDGDVATLGQLNDRISFSGVPTGAVQGFRRASAPEGWVKENGGTIGNTASGATTRANSDTQALFTLLWNEFSNTMLPIQDSAGLASTRGSSAAADFAANKRMPLFDSRTRFMRGADDGLGFDTSLTVGTIQSDGIKNHTHTGTTASSGAHNHTINGSGASDDAGPFVEKTGTNDGNPISTNSAGSHTHTFTTDSNGEGLALETRPRSSVLLFCIKL